MTVLQSERSKEIWVVALPPMFRRPQPCVDADDFEIAQALVFGGAGHVYRARSLPSANFDDQRGACFGDDLGEDWMIRAPALQIERRHLVIEVAIGIDRMQQLADAQHRNSVGLRVAAAKLYPHLHRRGQN